MSDLWVFGYGSLMWRPGFGYETVVPATLTGYRRCFCIYSVHHRGSALRPGLVLGLDRGGICHGLAFRVAASRVDETLAYLRAREQVDGVYRETLVALDVGRDVDHISAIAYIAERDHPSYAGLLPLAEQARLIRTARGLSGSNLEYLASTLDHLAQLGLRERELERVMTRSGPLFQAANIAVRSARIAALVNDAHRLPVSAPRLKRGDRRRFMHRQLVKPS
jgi:glutathione-specific gamma-glutamylcyclotransferase